jgi:tetratricopeptide (TPR) repeat protein
MNIQDKKPVEESRNADGSANTSKPDQRQAEALGVLGLDGDTNHVLQISQEPPLPEAEKDSLPQAAAPDPVLSNNLSVRKDDDQSVQLGTTTREASTSSRIDLKKLPSKVAAILRRTRRGFIEELAKLRSRVVDFLRWSFEKLFKNKTALKTRRTLRRFMEHLTKLPSWVFDSVRRSFGKLFKNKTALTIEAPKGFPRVAEHVSGLRTIAIDVVLIVLLVALITTVLREIRRDVVIVEPFTLSPELIKEGYTPESVSRILVNKVDLVTKKANTNMSRREFASSFSESLPDIEVPEAHISLRSFVGYIKGFFSSKYSRIEGEVSMHEKELRLLVRVIRDREVHSELNLTNITGEDVDAALQKGAQYILKQIEPYILASYFHSTGDTDTSLVLIQYCLYHDPPDDDCWAFNLWGLILYDEGKYEDAIEKYQVAIDRYPGKEFAVAYGNWALALAKRGRLNEIRGHVNEAKQDFTEAEEKCKIALKLDSKSPTSHDACGLTKQIENELDEAEQEFREAVRLSPNFVKAYNDWGNLLADNRNDYRGARDKFMLAIEIEADDSDAHNNLGDALEHMEEFDGAAKAYRTSSDLDKRSAVAPQNLGDVFLKQKKCSDARASYEEAIKRTTQFPPRDLRIREESLATLYRKLSDVAEVERLQHCQ